MPSGLQQPPPPCPPPTAGAGIFPSYTLEGRWLAILNTASVLVITPFADWEKGPDSGTLIYNLVHTDSSHINVGISSNEVLSGGLKKKKFKLISSPQHIKK